MDFKGLVVKIIGILDWVVVILGGFALLVFLYGVLMYIINSGDESKRKESIQYIVYGVIGLFVIISVWGLVNILSGTFGLEFGVPKISF